MRRIIGMICEMACEDNKHDNQRIADIRECYQEIDAAISSPADPRPVLPSRLREALVVGDFPLYFARTLNRGVYDRYQHRMGTWQDYTYPETATDYTNLERFTFTEPERPALREEKEEAYATYITESHLTLAVEDYAKQIDFSRRIFVNDDLGAFNNIILKMGDAAAMFESFLVSALYDNALTWAAILALGVNYWGTGRLTTANLAIGWNGFAQRVDGRGNPLSIRPMYLVIPPILELTANQILQSERIAELATNSINPLRGSVQVRVDPYIGFTVPNVPWYLFAAPSDVPGVSVVRMQGQPGPRLYAKAPDKLPISTSGTLGSADWRLGSFISGDIEIEVETTIGSRNDDLAGLVGVTDANGIYISNGTTP